MKSKLMIAAFLAACLTGVEVRACNIYATVVCPGGAPAAGVIVSATATDGTGESTWNFTDASGLVHLQLGHPATYIICVDPTTLPAGATIKNGDVCQKMFVPDVGPGVSVEFLIGGDFCATPPPTGPCWMTGGGNIGTGKTPDFSYGGVVYPGCSPFAAGGGNWNVVDHTGLHFTGENITVKDCLGLPTGSPKVTVRIIDFFGTGEITGVGGNPQATINVTFVGRAIDNHDGGKGADQLYLQVVDPISNTVVMQIGASAANPATVSVGNIQIHQSSCSN
jgi:hypothetical protein